MPDTGLQGELI